MKRGKNYQAGNESGLFKELLSRAEGDIIIQAGGIIQKSSADEIDNLNQEPTATWHLSLGHSQVHPLCLLTLIFTTN
jgi:hypothetical protein